MATWGSWVYDGSGHGFRLGYDITSLANSDTSQTLRLRIYMTVNWGVSDCNNTWTVTGDFPTRSGTYDGPADDDTSACIVCSNGQTITIYDDTRVVTKVYGSTQYIDFSASLSGLDVYGTGLTGTVSGGYTVQARPYSAPTAPSNVTATRVSDTQQTIAWTRNATTGAPYDNILVQRRIGGGSWSTVATLSGTATNWSDTTTAKNGRYDYQVAARNSVATSSYTRSSPDVSTTPNNPGSVAVAKSGSNNVLTWSATDSGYPTGWLYWEVQYSTNGGSSWTTLSTGIDKTLRSYTHSSPSLGYTYIYRIRGRAPNTGQSADPLYSSYVNSNSLLLPAVPAAPTNVAATRVSDTQQTITWTRNETAGAPYDNIVVQRRVSGGSWATLSSTVSGSATSYTDSTTAKNARYEYQVAAKNTAGTSSYTRSSPDVSTTPNNVWGVTATKIASGDIQVTWSASDSNYPSGYLYYEVEESINSGSSWTVKSTTLAVGTRSYTHVSPSLGDTHLYRVRSRSVTPTLYSSYVNSNTVQLASVPNAPTGLSPNGAIRDLTDSNAISWVYNPTDSSEITKRELRWRISGDVTWVSGGEYTTNLLSTTINEAYITGLLPGASNGDTLEWAVRTWGAHPDPSDWSATATIILRSKPTVNVTDPTDSEEIVTSTLSVTWTYFQAESSAQASWVAQLLKGGSVVQTKSASGTGNSTVFYGLDNDSTYDVQVTVTSVDGFSSALDSVTITTNFLPPVLVDATGYYDEDSASVVLQLTPQAVEAGVTVDASTVTIERKIDDGDWHLVGDNLPPGSSVIDTQPTIHGVNCYRLTVYSDLPSARTQFIREIATTLYDNGSFETPSGATTVVRTNYSENPRPSAGWGINWGTGGAGNLSYESASALSVCDLYYHAEWTAASSDVGRGTESPLSAEVPIGRAVVSLYVRTSVAQNMQVQTAGTGTWSTIEAPIITTVPGEWTRLYAVLDVTVAGQVQARAYASTGGHAWQIGETLDVSGLLIEAVAVLRPYFDGVYTPDPDFTSAWDSTADGSISVLTGEMLVGASHGNGRFAVQSSQWSKNGAFSGRCYPNPVSSYTSAETAWGISLPTLSSMGFVVGDTVTIRATLHMDEPMTTSPHALARCIWIGVAQSSPLAASSAAPNTAGDHLVELTWTITDLTSANVRLAHGEAPWRSTTEETPSVWWDDVVIVRGDGSNLPDDFWADSEMVLLTDSWSNDLTISLGPVDNGDGTVSYAEECFLAVPAAEEVNSFLTTGPGFDELVVLMCEPRISVSTTRNRTIQAFAGRVWPVEMAGQNLSQSITVSGSISGRGENDSMQALETLAVTDSIVLWRDPTGRRMYGSIGPVNAGQAGLFVPHAWNPGFTIRRVDHDG